MTCKNCEKLSKTNIDLLMANKSLTKELSALKASINILKTEVNFEMAKIDSDAARELRIMKEREILTKNENKELKSIIEDLIKEGKKFQEENKYLKSKLQASARKSEIDTATKEFLDINNKINKSKINHGAHINNYLNIEKKKLESKNQELKMKNENLRRVVREERFPQYNNQLAAYQDIRSSIQS